MASAVLFDLEGTLIDLSAQHILAYGEVLRRRYNLEFTRKDFLSGYGMHPWRIIQGFLESRGIKASREECERLAEEKQNILREKYSNEVRALPGAKELLSKLKAEGYKLALASSSPRKNVEFMLGKPGLREFFDVVVVGEDVPEAKPNPLVFLLAAEKLGVQPKDCVVFEDSIPGVRAGKAAGMKVVAVLTGGRTKAELSAEGADLVVENLVGVKLSLL